MSISLKNHEDRISALENRKTKFWEIHTSQYSIGTSSGYSNTAHWSGVVQSLKSYDLLFIDWGIFEASPDYRHYAKTSCIPICILATGQPFYDSDTYYDSTMEGITVQFVGNDLRITYKDNVAGAHGAINYVVAVKFK